MLLGSIKNNNKHYYPGLLALLIETIEQDVHIVIIRVFECAELQSTLF